MTYGVDYFSPDYVSRIAHAVLTSAAATLSPAPTTQFVSAGKPVADGCDQLAVWLDAFKLVRPRTGARGAGAFAEDRQSLNPQGGLPAIDLQVQLIRCGAPDVTGGFQPQSPEATALDAFATAQLTDGWALYRGLLAAWNAGSLFAGLEHAPASVVIGQGTPYGVEGGLAGWQIPITVSLY